MDAGVVGYLSAPRRCRFNELGDTAAAPGRTRGEHSLCVQSSVSLHEPAVESAGSSDRADAFRAWNRPSTLGRIDRRISGRVRRV
ncbi:hypothetical protein [Streptomyces sp. NPDC052179]|uniref:hypothetical protein n=1 Tax=Streptomyces sp. NPDC052179 TaxID=3155680 RepID=UPI003412C0DC